MKELTHVCLPEMTQFYLHSTELTIRDYGLGIPSAPDKMGMSQLKRLKNLDETLSTIERWLEVFQGKTASEWAGLSVDHFSQFMHCLVVLFKLTTTTAHPDWRPEDVRQRADLIRVLDHVCAALDRLSAELGIVEPSEEDGGPRSLFWKAKFLFRAVRALFVAEMGGGGGGESSSSGPSPAATAFSYDSGIGQSNSSDGAAAVVGDFAIPDEFLVGLSAEPWLTDIYEPWNFDAGDFFSEVV
ncbi:hypothetical protein BX600DRAFT_301089 [Xylariales sp. PMI_506]|nr:hypothetical protein BX600DRAFT_301089 [Xylariales sp. PMI_506]